MLYNPREDKMEKYHYKNGLKPFGIDCTVDCLICR